NTTLCTAVGPGWTKTNAGRVRAAPLSAVGALWLDLRLNISSGGAVTASAAVATSRPPATHVRTAASAKAGRRRRRAFAPVASEGDGEEGSRCDPRGPAKAGEAC